MTAPHRFEFELLSSDGLEFFNSVRNSAAPYLHDSRLFSISETKTWFDKKKKGEYWIIFLDESKIGYFRSRLIDSETIEIGADLHPEYQGKGLARPAYREFATQKLAPRGFNKCTLRVLKSNLRAIELYKSLGFLVSEETGTDFQMMLATSHLLTP